MDEKFILTKNVDWSLLNRGFAIPVNMQSIISLYLTNNQLQHGEKRQITLIFENESHIVTLTSVNFNKNKYPEHTEMWQIIYRQNGTFAKKLRAIFNKSYYNLCELRENKQKGYSIKLPDNERESIALYTTNIKDTFYIEPIFNEELKILTEEENETFVENLLNISSLTDSDAKIIEKYNLAKIRKLNRKIGDYLKNLYTFRCQICGEAVGNLYNTKIVECHHIDYFVKSLNNDSNNLLIVCPNHHRIIHATNPYFNIQEKSFVYPNGYIEYLRLNLHL